MGYEFWPEALEQTIRYVAAQTKVPVYVTETGIGTEDDTRRVEYIKRALAGVSNCLRDKIDVRGYVHWSLLDNFEWNFGYRPKFGLVAVNRETQERTPKPARSPWAISRGGMRFGEEEVGTRSYRVRVRIRVRFVIVLVFGTQIRSRVGAPAWNASSSALRPPHSGLCLVALPCVGGDDIGREGRRPGLAERREYRLRVSTRRYLPSAT